MFTRFLGGTNAPTLTQGQMSVLSVRLADRQTQLQNDRMLPAPFLTVAEARKGHMRLSLTQYTHLLLICVQLKGNLVVVSVVPAGYPRITENPVWKTVQKDSEATLSCSATGDPVPTISWLKNFVPLDMSDPRISILPSGSLLLCSDEFVQNTNMRKICRILPYLIIEWSYEYKLYYSEAKAPVPVASDKLGD